MTANKKRNRRCSFEAKMKNMDKEANYDEKWVSPGSLCCVRHSCKECFRVGVEVPQVRLGGGDSAVVTACAIN
jgi:streptolysin S family bacteriocin protoxin